MPSLPSPVRAALGLAATVADEARHIPDRAIEFPMRAVSWSLQLSLLAQQRYAALTARGDEIIAARQMTDEPPSWAVFDDDPAPGRNAVFDDDPAPAGSAVLDDDPAPSGNALFDDDPAPAGKAVHAPRTAPPSPFDAVGDDEPMIEPDDEPDV